MVPVGYEPDLYIPELNGEGAEKNKGTVQDYQDMWDTFDMIFKEEGADNVVWVMDFSWDIRDNLWIADLLWPQNVEVGWLFWNMFQFQKIDNGNVGDCMAGFDKIYEYMNDPEKPWYDLPWGLGAWGTPKMTWDPPFEDKETCIMGTAENFASGNYPKMKASISFNSSLSLMQDGDDPHQEQMVPTFEEFLSSSFFYDDAVDYEEDCSLFIDGTDGC